MKYSKSGKLRERYSKTSSHREFRLADQIQKELAKLFHSEVKDPRINFITITDVEQLAGTITEQLAALFEKKKIKPQQNNF